MVKRLLLMATVGIFVAAGLAGSASAFEERIPTKISLLKWGGKPRVGKLYKIVSKPSAGLFVLPTPGPSDPIALGGALTVTVGPDVLECDLQAGDWDGSRGWKGLGNPAGSKGYKYINKGAPGSDPCKIAIIKEKVIKVLAKSVGGISLPGPPGTNPDVTMDLVAGEDKYCAEALAPHFKEKENTLIKMKDEPAPLECPLPEIGAHKCVLDETPGTGSSVTMAIQSGPLPTLSFSGSLDIICGAIDPVTGIAPCECNIQQLEPMDFLGLGFVCFSPSSGCEIGQIDCDGGDPLNVDLVSDHILGPCADKVDCVAQCTAACPGGHILTAACEGFCNGGVNDNLPCVADSDCPGGSCPGTEAQTHGNICNCDCVTVGGAPTPPGTLQCDIATSVEVETAAPCGDGDVTLSIGTQCIPVTAATFTSIMHNANNTPGKDFPLGGSLSTGVPLAGCDDLDASLTTGLELAGGANFYDAVIGDVSVSTRFVCQ